MKRIATILISILVLLNVLMIGCGVNQESKISKEISEDQRVVVKSSPAPEALQTGGGDYQRINSGFKGFIKRNWPYDTIFEIGPYVVFGNQVWTIRNIWGVRAWGTDLYGNFIFYSRDYGDNWRIQWHDTYSYMYEDLHPKEIQAFDASRLFVHLVDNDYALRKSSMVYAVDGGKTWERYFE